MTERLENHQTARQQLTVLQWIQDLELGPLPAAENGRLLTGSGGDDEEQGRDGVEASKLGDDASPDSDTTTAVHSP